MNIHLTKFCDEQLSTLLDCCHLDGVSWCDRDCSFWDEQVLSAKSLLYSHSHGPKKGKLVAVKKSGDAAQGESLCVERLAIMLEMFLPSMYAHLRRLTLVAQP